MYDTDGPILRESHPLEAVEETLVVVVVRWAVFSAACKDDTMVIRKRSGSHYLALDVVLS